MAPDDATRQDATEDGLSSRPHGRPMDFFGEDYSIAGEEEMGRQQPSGHPLSGDTSIGDAPVKDAGGRDFPPEAGRRAWFDSKTGEVHGSGSGAGSVDDGEDYDEDTAGGS